MCLRAGGQGAAALLKTRAILLIIEAPNPILSTKAREVRADEFGDDLAQPPSMVETMYAGPAGPRCAPGRGRSGILVIGLGFEGEEGEAQKGVFLQRRGTWSSSSAATSITWEERFSVPRATT